MTFHPYHHFRGLEIPYLPLDELLATCDYISLHAPLLPSTKHMISFEKLAIMKKGIMKHGSQHENSGVTTMRFPRFLKKKVNEKYKEILRLGNKRIQGGVCLQSLDLCLHAVCKLQRIFLKRMYSTSSLFQAMEL